MIIGDRAYSRFLSHTLRIAGFVVVMAAATASTFGWTTGHGPATQAAMEVQPSWVRKIWEGQQKNLIDTYATYPESPVKHNDYDTYVFKYKDSYFNHFPPESMSANRKRCQAGFTFYYEKIADAVRAADMTAAAKFAGCLGHVLQNCGSPQEGLQGPQSPAGHDYPTGYPLLMQLFPTPPEKALKPAHLVLAGIVGDQKGQTMADIKGYRPRLLGATPGEAAFHTYERYWDLYRSARSGSCDIIEAYNRDDTPVVRKRMSDMIKECARVTADVLYTATCIAKGRFEAEEVAKLKVIHLEDVTLSSRPTYMPPALLYSHHPVIEDANLNKKRDLVPLTVLMKRDGKVDPVSFTDGLGTGCGTSCTLVWDIPAGVYDELRVVCGLNAKLKSQTKCRFFMKFKGKVVHETGPISEADAVKEWTVDVKGGGQITLRAERDGPPYPVNHLVWGNPRLIRADLPGGRGGN